MCNCGNKRSDYAQSKMQPAKEFKTAQVFKYTGKTALTVTGLVSQKKYRFEKPGDEETIDHRDVIAMMNVPVLKKIS